MTVAERPGALECPACPACQGEPIVANSRPHYDRRHGLPGHFGLVACPQCGLVVTTPRPSSDSIGGYYPRDYVSFTSEAARPGGARRLMRNALRVPYRVRFGAEDATASLAPGRVLDVGCGAGIGLADLAGRGWDVWGVESSEEAAVKARSRLGSNPDRIRVARAEDVEFAKESFDLVVMSHVLEHLHEPRVVLERIREWLAPEGLLVLRVPNIESLEAKAFGRLWFGIDVPRHLFHFSPRTLRQLVQSAGFEVVSVRPQFQASSLSGSVSHATRTFARRGGSYRHSQRLYFAVLPIAALLLGMGQGGTFELVARRSESKAG